jgi:S-DNA-T family DNA segregation ATPase FtsK/SpoIIIE
VPIGTWHDGPLVLDLARDGPHALIAGTTGSGKSELLQTLLTALAASNPPEDLTFLLIDYKGGAAFEELSRLPHTVGVVTDLDEPLTRRALASLDAELRRRERVLAEAGVADVGALRGLPTHERLPRLVVVVDEFAALARDVAMFVPAIVSIAQRGRSLGVHLVLATQRPGGCVSADLRANIALRIALRTHDAADSVDVVDCADAATLPAGRPGSGYVRTDHLTAFRAARVNHRYPASPSATTVRPVDAWGSALPDSSAPDYPTDLAELVDATCDAAARTNRGRPRRPWLDPLPARLAPDQLAGPPDPASIPIGLVDLPAEQSQPTEVLDALAGGSVLVVGNARAGRTSVLAMVASQARSRLGPAVAIHAIDCHGGLRDAAGRAVDELMDAEDPTIVLRALASLDGRGGPRLLLVDGWDALRAGESYEWSRVSATLDAVVQTAHRSRLTVVLTAGRTILASRAASDIDRRYVLRLSDPADYALAGINPRHVAIPQTPGRAIRASDCAEIQFATIGPAGFAP